MAVHRFKVGQTVNYAPIRPSMPGSSRDYKIIKTLPPENGQNQYRIKSLAETFERVARESELSNK